MAPAFTPTERTRVRRLAKRGVYDQAQIYAILDEGFICHAAFVRDGHPFAIPTGYGRAGDQLYLHGSAASRLMTHHGDRDSGIDVCVTVTLVDGFVLARSAFHHSMNYRSVVVLGRARLVADSEEKVAALRCITNHIVPDRWQEVREPTARELQGTAVLALTIEEASAKVRTGPPIDDEEDYALPVWAGVVPIAMEVGAPVDDGRVPSGVAVFDRSRVKRGVSSGRG
jgi:nitroimidazol reductase NimA-like FMN-containing flavoprotein (pyridoxamine 5'-phosphate oxidase superfamily)